MKNANRFPHLQKIPLLEDFPKQKKHDFLNQCTVVFCETPKKILQQGEHVSGMYIIAHGTVAVSYTLQNDKNFHLRNYKPGGVLGIYEAVADQECLSTCLAQAGTALLFCPTPLILEHLKSPIFIRNFAAQFCTILARDNKLRFYENNQPIIRKICTILMEMTNSKYVYNGSQADISKMVGCSRQTMNQILQRLQDEGLIELRRGQIVILDPAQFHHNYCSSDALLHETSFPST